MARPHEVPSGREPDGTEQHDDLTPLLGARPPAGGPPDQDDLSNLVTGLAEGSSASAPSTPEESLDLARWVTAEPADQERLARRPPDPSRRTLGGRTSRRRQVTSVAIAVGALLAVALAVVAVLV